MELYCPLLDVTAEVTAEKWKHTRKEKCFLFWTASGEKLSAHQNNQFLQEDVPLHFLSWFLSNVVLTQCVAKLFLNTLSETLTKERFIYKNQKEEENEEKISGITKTGDILDLCRWIYYWQQLIIMYNDFNCHNAIYIFTNLHHQSQASSFMFLYFEQTKPNMNNLFSTVTV